MIYCRYRRWSRVWRVRRVTRRIYGYVTTSKEPAEGQSVLTLLASNKVPSSNKLQLAILYALRYQKLIGNQIAQVVDALIQNGVGADRARLVYVMLNFAGADVRQDDLFMNENFFSRGKSALKGLKVGDIIALLTMLTTV